MPHGSVQNYQGSADGIERLVLGGNVFVKCFNNTTATTFTNGDAVIISGLSANSGESANTHYPTIITPVTSSVAVTVGVVDNSFMGKTTIGLLEWGWVQIQGYCQAVTKTTASNPIAIDDYLKAMNTVSTVATDGTSGSTVYSAKSFAVAKSVVNSGAAGTCTAFLLGLPVTI